MRITFVAPTANMSGGIKVVAIYAQRLSEMGHQVVVVSPSPQIAPLRRRLKSWLEGKGWPTYTRFPPSHFDGLGLDHRVLESARPVADRDVPDADVVIATWWETAEWVHALSATKGAKVYFIQHHEVFPHLEIDRPKRTYQLPLHKVVVARWLQELMRSQYGDEVVDLVPNSVDRAQFFSSVRGKQSIPTVGFLYHSSPAKGVDLTLRVLELVRERYRNVRVISFGSERPGGRLHLPSEIEFVLNPAQHEIRTVYSQCDVWITASRTEGFNLPALEAMACRAPVVSTRAGWPAEVVRTGWNGVLVDVDDIRGLADGVVWVLSQTEDSWRTLSRNAFETAASGSWEESAKRFESALLHACCRAERGEILGRCRSGVAVPPENRS